MNAEAPLEALEAATSAIAFASFLDAELEEHADIVFPAEIYPEKEGTVTHPDGRLQRVRQALGRAGEVRAGWQVLAELCERVGAPVGALTGADGHRAHDRGGAVLRRPDPEEIGGLGVRWQDREAAAALEADEPSAEPLADPPAAPGGRRVVAVPTLWSGPTIEHSPSLRFLAAGPRAELSPDDARAAGVAQR